MGLIFFAFALNLELFLENHVITWQTTTTELYPWTTKTRLAPMDPWTTKNTTNFHIALSMNYQKMTGSHGAISMNYHNTTDFHKALYMNYKNATDSHGTLSMNYQNTAESQVALSKIAVSLDKQCQLMSYYHTVVTKWWSVILSLVLLNFPKHLPALATSCHTMHQSYKNGVDRMSQSVSSMSSDT